MAKRGPKPDSWHYLGREFNKRVPSVKKLLEFLEAKKLRFYARDTSVLADRVRRGPPVTAGELPNTVDEHCRDELVMLLAEITLYYTTQREKRREREALRLAQLEAYKCERIPQADLDLLAELKKNLNKISNFQDREQVDMRTYNLVDAWANLPGQERQEFFRRVQSDINDYERRQAEERKKWQRAWDEYQRTGNFGWGYIDERLVRNGITGNQALNILGLNPGASPDEIKAAWRRLVKQFHPDAGGDAAEFMKVQDAYRYLSSSL